MREASEQLQTKPSPSYEATAWGKLTAVPTRELKLVAKRLLLKRPHYENRTPGKVWQEEKPSPVASKTHTGFSELYGDCFSFNPGRKQLGDSTQRVPL